MQYLITNLWKLPAITGAADAQDDRSSQTSETMLAAACRDCDQYNFPPKGQCRYCGSPRMRTVQLSGEEHANPGTWIFGMSATPTSDKPN